MNLTLNSPIGTLRGVGAARQAAFRHLGITTLAELIKHYPRDYQDRTIVTPMADLQPGQTAQFRGVILKHPVTQALAGGRFVTRSAAGDDSGGIELTFFNMPFVSKSLHDGEEYLFYGKITEGYRGLQAVSPVFEAITPGTEPKGSILPIYPLTEGLNNRAVSAAVKEALKLVTPETVPDPLPESLRTRRGLLSLWECLHAIHFPKDLQQLQKARERLVYGELLAYSLGLMLFRAEGEHTVPPIPCPAPEAFFGKLGFSPTAAQQKVLAEIYGDLARGKAMSRLLQGDVGSGKTAVAAAACWAVVRAGGQAAFMAPTEVLAAQHYGKLQGLFAREGYQTALLTGHTPAAERRAVKAGLEDGSIRLCFGTHALFTEDVTFRNLRLAVCDEQQRFGVAQRAALIAKGESPHVLCMSATPIPRTLALILYGDLDISVIDSLPPGRKPVATYAVGEDYRSRIEAFVRKQVQAGRQVYIVCPAIEDSTEGQELRSVQAYAESARQTYGDLRVGFLHGKMKPTEKAAVMARFSAGEIDVLVSTTVIEVGVDNPNASLMVIENAERFGLSQLHQLRGRVGRGSAEAYCVLMSEKSDIPRLQILTQTNDGFVIAAKDLELRGPGEFFGSRQAGVSELRLANLSGDMRVLEQARNDAKQLLQADPSLNRREHGLLRQSALSLFKSSVNRFN